MSRGRLWFLICAAVLLVARAALPFGVEWVIESQATRAFGRRVQVGDVDLALLRGLAVVEDLHVGAAPSAETREPSLARLGRLVANFEWTRLLSGEIRLRELTFVSPSMRLERQPDGQVVPISSKARP
jgi:hypothetical protein